VLYVESPQRNAFNHEDIQTLHTLVSHVATSIQKARLFTQVQEHLRANTALQSISQTVSSSLELETIFQTVIQLLKDTFDYTYLSIYLLDGAILRLGAQVGYPAEMIIYEIPVSSGVIGRTVVTQQTQFISDVNKDPDFLRASYEVESEICVPLLKEGAVLGVINIEAAPGRPLTENDVDLMTTLAGSVAIAIDNARLHAEVRSLAMTDAMTKLPNRRAFDLTLATEIARAERYGHPLGLIIFDLDNFKLYNDRWGHPAGDERLIEVAKLLQTNARSPDVAARYGGEEFALILPFTARNGALALAERIRKAAESQAGETGKIDGYIPGYTISVGVANFPENGRLASDLLYSADHAALAAKRQGKNRICVAGDIDEIINR
jgi:diguanylate cyclase (GGDEF)-like protein